jgi:hypothetical protein
MFNLLLIGTQADKYLAVQAAPSEGLPGSPVGQTPISAPVVASKEFWITAARCQVCSPVSLDLVANWSDSVAITRYFKSDGLESVLVIPTGNATIYSRYPVEQATAVQSGGSTIGTLPISGNARLAGALISVEEHFGPSLMENWTRPWLYTDTALNFGNAQPGPNVNPTLTSEVVPPEVVYSAACFPLTRWHGTDQNEQLFGNRIGNVTAAQLALEFLKVVPLIPGTTATAMTRPVAHSIGAKGTTNIADVISVMILEVPGPIGAANDFKPIVTGIVLSANVRAVYTFRPWVSSSANPLWWMGLTTFFPNWLPAVGNTLVLSVGACSLISAADPSPEFNVATCPAPVLFSVTPVGTPRGVRRQLSPVIGAANQITKVNIQPQ